MASDTQPSQLRGLALMDARIGTDTWASESSFTQAGPQPGVPKAQGSYDLVLKATGTQAAGDALRIQAIEGGHPEPGGGGYIWRKDGDPTWRGHDGPAVAVGWEHVVWTDGGAPAFVKSTKGAHAVTLDDGTILVCYQDATSTLHRVVTQRRDPATHAWGSAVMVYQKTGGAPSVDYSPCLTVLPDGSVLLFHWVEDTAHDEAQIRMHSTTDGGATWAVGSTGVLKDAVDTSSATTGWIPGRLRAAYAGGQVLLIGQAQSNDTALVSRELWFQWASTSLGARFDLADNPTTSGIYMGSLDIVANAGRFHVLFCGGASGGDDLVMRTISSAYERLTSVPEAVIHAAVDYCLTGVPSSIFTDAGDCALVLDDSGTMWAYARDADAGDIHEGMVHMSLDTGVTWKTVGVGTNGAGVSQWWSGHDANAYPVNYAATWQGGRVVLFHNWIAAVGNEDNSLGAFYLGGYSTMTMPGLRDYRNQATQSGWIRNWIPIELPGDTGWTATGVGSEGLDVGSLGITTAANFKHYQVTPPGSPTPASGAIVHATVQMVSGGSLVNDQVAIRAHLDDGGTNGIEVKIRAQTFPPRLRLLDGVSGAQIGTDMIVDWTTPIDVVVALQDANAAIWWRSSSTDGDRVWTAGPTTNTLTNSGGGGASAIQWGHHVASASETKWRALNYSAGAHTGLGLAGGQTNPDDIQARTFAGYGFHQWVDGGTKITATDGPARIGDTWHVDTDYRYELARVFPSHSPTPRAAWRSTGTAAESIALTLDTTLLGTAPHAMGSDTVALTLLGCNWATGVWEGYDAATSTWLTLANLDFATGLGGLPWARFGNSIFPGGTGASAPYIHAGEFDGATFDLGGGVLRRVKSTIPGKWTNAANAKKAGLILEDVDGTEPATGTGAIRPSDLVVVANLLTKIYSGYRIRLNAGPTLEGYQKIGAMVVGPVAYFGTQYSWGRTVETTVNVATDTRQDGTTWTRVLGPASRRVDFGWTDGIDITGISGTDPDPDYFTATGSPSAQAVGTDKDVPFLMDGLLRQLDGPHRPVVYLPRVDRGAPDVIQLNRRHQFMAGRLASPVRVESIHGDEDDPTSGEVVRVATLTLEELV